MFNFQNYNPRNFKAKIKYVLNEAYYKSRSVLHYLRLRLNNFKKISNLKTKIFVGVFIMIFLFYHMLIVAPRNFPVGSIVTIEEGLTLSEISNYLENENVIKSEMMFEFFANLLMNGKGVMAGGYFFEKDYTVVKIVWRTIRGDCGITPTRVTVIEGHTIFDIAETFKKKFDYFDEMKFLKLAENEEGYLFPDTYYFLPNVTPKIIINTMKENFYLKIDEISSEIEESGKTLEEVVIMASILEKEARTLKSKQMIAGLLWKRIDIGMPLQVDAVFPYINGKNTYQLSLDDLKIESPYNTYANKGLPIGPIANPSIYSLLAAVTPIESDYLFYLSDRAGNMYYAEDFEGHKKNRILYMD